MQSFCVLELMKRIYNEGLCQITSCKCFLFFLIAAFIDRFNQVRLDICRLKYLNSECNAVNLTDQIEFMEWTHVCTTFEVWDHDEVLRKLATKT